MKPIGVEFYERGYNQGVDAAIAALYPYLTISPEDMCEALKRHLGFDYCEEVNCGEEVSKVCLRRYVDVLIRQNQQVS